MNNEKRNKQAIQAQENIDTTAFTDWFTTAIPNHNDFTVTFTAPGTRHDAVISTTAGREIKIELKQLFTNYTQYTHWILNAEKIEEADAYWLQYADGYVVLATRKQIDSFITDYGDKAYITHRQKKTQVDPDSEYEDQVQINMPHTEAGKYFRLYKGQKRVK